MAIEIFSDASVYKKLIKTATNTSYYRPKNRFSKIKREYYGTYNFDIMPWNVKKNDYNLMLPDYSAERKRRTEYSEQNKTLRYREFSMMEFMPEIATALDVVASEMIFHSELEDILNISSPDASILKHLKDLFYSVMDVDTNLFGWARNFLQFGDEYLYLDIKEGEGIVGIINLPATEIKRIEGLDPDNPDYFKFSWEQEKVLFEPIQVAHFRNLKTGKYDPYGESYLEGCRRIHRQLTLVEDYMLAYRAIRSSERRVFYIDVGATKPDEIEPFIEKVANGFKRHSQIDESTGEVSLRYNPLSIEEDLFIPVRGSKTSTRIETLAGGKYVGDIDDVKYLRDKLFSSLKIPASYLTTENSTDRSTLSQKDIVFAKVIERLQQAFVSELYRIAWIHLIVLGRSTNKIEFSLSLNKPSNISEMQSLERLKQKVDVVKSLPQEFFSHRYIYENVLGMTVDEYSRIREELLSDAKFRRELAAKEEGGDMMEGMDGGDLGDMDEGDLGDLGDVGGEDIDMGGAEEEEGYEGNLIKSPDGVDMMARKHVSDISIERMKKRDGYLTQNSKGKKYIPKEVDDRKYSGNTRRTRAKVKPEIVKSIERNLNTLREKSKKPKEKGELLVETEDS